MRSLNGLIKQEYTDGQYNFERFTPHVTIGEQMPDEVFLSVKKRFSGYKMRYEIEMASFVLFSADEDGVWKRKRVFSLSG
jgi:2'-5' RNA ligase